MTAVRRPTAITKFGADADNDPFVKVKDLITDLIRLQAEASPETNQKSHCDEETSKATEKEDLETAVVEDRDLLSVQRVITSIEQKEKSKGEEQLASYAREYVAKWKMSSRRSVKASLHSQTRNSSDRVAPMSRRCFTTKMKKRLLPIHLPSLQQARQRAKLAKMPVTLVSKPTRSPRTSWL